MPAEALIVLGHGKPHFLLHVHAILAGSCLNEGPVEEVPIVRDIHTWFHLDRISSCLRSTPAGASRLYLDNHDVSHMHLTSLKPTVELLLQYSLLSLMIQQNALGAVGISSRLMLESLKMP